MPDERVADVAAAVEPIFDTAHMFPKLSAAMIDRLRPVGTERRIADGESLWRAGDSDIAFFVVLDGSIAILVGPDEREVTVHEPGNFTGDVDMLSGRQAAVHARAVGDTRLLEIDRGDLKMLVQTDVELGEMFLRAFILRRVALIESGLGNVVFVGSRHAAIRCDYRSSSRATAGRTATLTSTGTLRSRLCLTSSSWASTTCPSSSAGAFTS